jgi:hypothetical protein
VEKYYIDDVPKKKAKAIFKKDLDNTYPVVFLKKPVWVEQSDFEVMLKNILDLYNKKYEDA